MVTSFSKKRFLLMLFAVNLRGVWEYFLVGNAYSVTLNASLRANGNYWKLATKKTSFGTPRFVAGSFLEMVPWEPQLFQKNPR